MIFCDMGVNPTPWGYSAYDEIVRKLVARGIPRAQIAAVGDADSDAKKLALFEKVRSGSVRVLIGSTQKMGTGTNVQKRLVALHHLDAPWKPAEVEQRDGRILRQGNENQQVAVYRYVTEGSFDAYMWQALETKARFISQVMTGDNAVRRAEDIGGQELSYAEVKAIASGNPAVLTLAEADAESAAAEPAEAEPRRRTVPRPPPPARAARNHRRAVRAPVQPHGRHGNREGSRRRSHDHRHPHRLPRRRDRRAGARLDALPQYVRQSQRVPLGVYRGLRFGLVLDPQFAPEVYLEGASTRRSPLSREHHGPRAVLNALERLAGGYGSECSRVRQDLAIAESQLRDYKARLVAPPARRLPGRVDRLARPAQGRAFRRAARGRGRAAGRRRARRADQIPAGPPHRRGGPATHGKTPPVRRGAGDGEDTPPEPRACRGRVAAASARGRGQEGGEGVRTRRQSGDVLASSALSSRGSIGVSRRPDIAKPLEDLPYDAARARPTQTRGG